VTVGRAGRRSVVRVVVDRDAGIDLDAVAEASRLVSAVLDADDEVLAGPYVLEVTSPGVDRPLTQARHWRRARGRLVTVSLSDGRDVVGRVVNASEDAARLRLAASGDLRVAYDEVILAVVQVEFGGSKDAPSDDGGDRDDVHENGVHENGVHENDVHEGSHDDDHDAAGINRKKGGRGR
jgi:ribosome maturation factor RimP